MAPMSLGGALLTAVTVTVVAASLSAAQVTADDTGPTRTDALARHPLVEARSWTWPLAPEPVVLTTFAPPDRSWLPGHRGVDLAASGGQPVLSPTAGVVTFSGVLAGRGVVVVAHPGGLRSTFEPVVAGPTVGSKVDAGGPIGVVATTRGHCAPATCLHWGVLRGRTYLDPLGFVRHVPMVLLPLR